MDCDTEQAYRDIRWDGEMLVSPDNPIEKGWLITLAAAPTAKKSDKDIHQELYALIAEWWQEKPEVDEHSNLEDEFHTLAQAWRRASEHQSSIARTITDSNYQAIIGLAFDFEREQVIQLLLKELQKRPDYWFIALETLARENFRQKDGDFQRERKAWLKWGKDKGYL